MLVVTLPLEATRSRGTSGESRGSQASGASGPVITVLADGMIRDVGDSSYFFAVSV